MLCLAGTSKGLRGRMKCIEGNFSIENPHTCNVLCTEVEDDVGCRNNLHHRSDELKTEMCSEV